jgi:hypothetical protein
MLLAAAYVLRRRGRSAQPLPAASPPPAAAAVRAPAPAEIAPAPPPPLEEAEINEPAAHTTGAVEENERPLATWARVTIVVVALLAFFVVSLIATKQV